MSTSSAQQLGDDSYEYDCDGGSYDDVVVDADDDADDGLMIHNPHHHVCIMLSAWAHRGTRLGSAASDLIQPWISADSLL